MRRRGKYIYRIGDLVEIVNPEIYVRIGYPYSYEVAKSELESIFLDDVIKFKDAVYTKLTNTIKNPEFESIRMLDKDFIKISEDRFVKVLLKTISYEKVYFEKFGGLLRNVVTKYDEEYKGCCGVILKKKIVQSGKYNVTSTYDIKLKKYKYNKRLDMYNRHVILDVSCDKYPNNIIKIEDNHVKKITEFDYTDDN